MSFDITKHHDAAAAELLWRANGTAWGDIHPLARTKYRDIIASALPGVLVGRTDGYTGLDAIAADIIAGWGVVKVVPAVVKVTEQPKVAVSGDAVKNGLVESVKKLAGRGKKTTDK